MLTEEQQSSIDCYETDLLSYINTKHYIRKSVILKSIVDKYSTTLGLTQRDIVQHAALASMPGNDEERKIITLQDLLQEENNIPSWLVPNFIGAGGGLYLVAGAPKAGKTYVFVYNLAYSVAVTGDFLGYPCNTGKVLIFQCEESEVRIRRKFRSKGISTFNPDIQDALKDNRIQIEKSFKIDSDLQYLSQRVEEFKPSLVIFDSLRAITSHLDVSENSVDFSKYLYTLQRYLNKLEVPGVIIHHLKKGGGSLGVEGLSGSLSIAGASDGVIMLDPRKETSGHTINVSTIPRDGLPINFLVQRRKDEMNRWAYFYVEGSEKNISTEQIRLEKKILRFLSKTPGQNKSRRDIIEGLSLQNEEDKVYLDSALDRLVEGLQIGDIYQKGGRVLYWISEVSPWAKIGVSSYLGRQFEDAETLAKCNNSYELDLLKKKWESQNLPSDYKSKLWHLLSKVEQDKIFNITYPRNYSAGDWVLTPEKEKKKVVSYHFSNEEKDWEYILEGESAGYIQNNLSEVLDYSISF